MSMKKLLYLALLVGAVLALILRVFARRASAKPASNSGSNDAIDAYIEEQMHRLKMPGVSLAIVEGDEIVHMRGFGRARPGGEAPTPQTPFVLGSTTKSFTALAVMQLVESGKIELDAPVQRYLPWFRVADPHASAQITVRHLLNQTSGLPGSAGELPLADFDNSPSATERQARALATVALTHPVGTDFEYCHSNYSVLGLIIEAASEACLAQRHAPRFLLLYGASARAKERRGPALQCRSALDDARPGGLWCRRGRSARRRTARSAPGCWHDPLDAAWPAAHSSPPNCRRRRYAAPVKALAPGS